MPEIAYTKINVAGKRKLPLVPVTRKYKELNMIK